MSPTTPSDADSRIAYPPAERLDLAEHVAGHVVRDPYRWLEDADDPRTTRWSRAQENLSRAWFDALPGRGQLDRHLRDLLRPGSVTLPTWAGGRAFFLGHHPDAEHPVLHVADAADPRWRPAEAAVAGADHGPAGRPVLDVGAIDPSGTTTLDAWAPSREGRLLAYQVSRGGTEAAQLWVLDVANGRVVDGPLRWCRYSSVAWLPGGEAFYYVRHGGVGAPPAARRVVLHRIGDPQEADTPLGCPEVDAATARAVDVSGDGRWLVIEARLGAGDGVWIVDLHRGGGKRVVDPAAGVRCRARVRPDGLLHLLTTDGAPRWRLCTSVPESPRTWTELIGEDPRGVLRDTVWFRDGPQGRPAVAALWARSAVSAVTVHDAAGGEPLHEVRLPGMGTVTGLAVADPGTAGLDDVVWVGWTDFRTPPSVYGHRAGAVGVDLVAPAPGTGQRAPVHAQQVTYSSADGTRVRMFLLARDEHPDRPRPALLTAYGGFGLSSGPVYSAAALAWVAAGGVWAMASVRGGGEEGEHWHRAGARQHKQHAIDDLHAAGDHLVGAGWTEPGMLGLLGASNGGLLVGAAVTQRPHAYRAAVCSAPLLDMARYERTRLGAAWAAEYGSAGVAEELGWLLAYSPYHHVRPGTRYPAVLLSVFDGDTRVDPAHARKACAALQHAAGAGGHGDRPVLLRRHRAMGHVGGAASRVVSRAVDEFAFLAWATGLTVDGPAAPAAAAVLAATPVSVGGRAVR